MTTVVISQPMLFPWPGMLEQVALADIHVHYDDVQFVRKSFTRRVQIKTPQGPAWLTIPTRAHRRDTLIADLVADDGQDWRTAMLRLLARTYARAPHVDAMLALVRGVIDRPDGLLAPLLIAGLETLAAAFGLADSTRFVRSGALEVPGRGSGRILAICRALGATRYVTGMGGLGYLDHAAFDAAGIVVDYMDYVRAPYPQLWGAFDPHVSALDLLANCGADAGRAVLQPRTMGWRCAVARQAAGGSIDRPQGADRADRGGPHPALDRSINRRHNNVS